MHTCEKWAQLSPCTPSPLLQASGMKALLTLASGKSSAVSVWHTYSPLSCKPWDETALPKSAYAGTQQKELACPGKGAMDKPSLSLTLLLC